MKTPSIDVTYLIRILTDLLDIPSPTGLADPAIAYVEQALRELDLQPRRTVKGALVAEWAGQSDDAPRALTAPPHVVTQHLVVIGGIALIKTRNLRLKFSLNSRKKGFRKSSCHRLILTDFSKKKL